jgi:oxygen-independent coproporphyrinogen-3 oxidase
VYLHVPFCVVRCGYCDFNMYLQRVGAQNRPIMPSMRAVKSMAARLTNSIEARPLHFFFGGGIPATDLALVCLIN